MRRRILLTGSTALVAAAILVPAGAQAGDPARVQIVEKEYTLTLSRLRIHSGQAIVQVLNFGMDNHDLIVQGNATGSRPVRFKQLGPGDRASLTIRLRPGKYTLWCSLPGHRARGMVAPLVVTA
jgi:plastocyanin